MSCERIEALKENAPPSAEELSEIREHEAACPACAALSLLGPSLRDEMKPRADDQVLVQRVVGSARRGVSQGRTRIRVALLAAAVVLIGTVALAGLGVFSSKPPAVLDPGVAPAIPQPRAPLVPDTVPPPSPVPSAKLELPPPRPSAPPKSASEPSAAELFAEASELRRNGKNAAAVQRYELLSARFPGSREEIASRVLSGNLVLASDPARALQRFEAYLATKNGALAEEAMLGRALALDRLGRSGEARQAWQDLLTRFPDSVQASRARARLEKDPD
jgi:hypothetical protein